jgi:mRNA interferase RelE/StbE
MPLLLHPDALNEIPDNDEARLMKKIEWLWVNRLLITHSPLHGDLSGFLKRRVGKYRIIYSYDEASDEMIIHLVGLRDTIYQNVPC